jgi:hypothetical protein
LLQPAVDSRLRLSALVDLLRMPAADPARAAAFDVDSQVRDNDLVDNMF